ncbi:MAG: DsrE/DsrF/DrsH-like family protein [Nitrososphaerota archaeon]
MVEKLAIVLFSGTVDKLYPVSIIASGAVAMGMEVDIFATFLGFKRVKERYTDYQRENLERL